MLRYSLLLTFFSLFLLASAELDPIQVDEGHLYDIGVFGRLPNSHLRSTRGVATRLGRLAWDPAVCDRYDEYFFIGIHGILLGHAGPMIFDNDGYQVWHGKGFGSTYNFRTQTYKGEQYLTWWAGNDQVRGHGEGYYYMLDKNYQLFKKVDAIGEDKRGDLHEFEITPDSTALLTIYHTIPYNLTAWGIGNSTSPGYIRDCLFQEIDLETNELIYEWSAIEHVKMEDCYSKPSGEGKTYENAWDWFHLNSVQKDDRGNYLISSRYSHSLFYIDGQSSETIWTFGGKNNSFEDLSGGNASSIKRQHHARWAETGTSGQQRAITVFDNGEKPNPSRGVKVLIDEEAMTTKLLAEAYHPLGYVSASQGSIQQLPSGNVLVGWGYAPAFSEFSPDGSEVLCDVQFAALHNNGSWSPGAQESYRVYRLPWQGWPLQEPEVSVDKREGILYVSWNGATEVRSWTVNGTRLSNSKGKPVQTSYTAKKQSFETSIEVDAVHFREFSLTAVGDDEAVLGSWSVGFQGVRKTLIEPAGRLPSVEKVGTDMDDSNSADDVYPTDSEEDVELVETYEATPSTDETEATEDSVAAGDAVLDVSSYDLVEVYDPASSPAKDPVSSTAESSTPSPEPATQSPESSMSSSSTFLILLLIGIAALFATHHFRPDLFASLRERLSSALPMVAAYLPQSSDRSRQRDTEEGDELESKGLMGQYNKEPRAEHGEKEAGDEDGDGEEGYREARAGQRS